MTIPGIYADILRQPHVIIAGATGSGKSVVLNGTIRAARELKPECKLILIDPKRVELCEYRHKLQTMIYASEPKQIVSALDKAVQVMEKRYKSMRFWRQKQSRECPIYICIDEYADLMTTQKRETQSQIIRIAQLGRAANIHLIICTQRPTRDIVTGQVKVNIDARLALRCPTAQDSRNIINVSGAELLPRYGMGYYLTADTMQPILIEIPIF